MLNLRYRMLILQRDLLNVVGKLIQSWSSMPFISTKALILFLHYFLNPSKKMINQDQEKIECAVGNREMGFGQGKKAEIVLISFLMSGFEIFISLWLLVLPNSKKLK